MEKKKGLNFFFLIILIVTGRALLKDIDFQNFTVKKPAIDTLYALAFLLGIVMLLKPFFSKEKAGDSTE